MLGQSIFTKVFGAVWMMIMFVIIIAFSRQFIAWFDPFQPKAWAALMLIIGILYFTNQNIIMSIFNGVRGSSNIQVQSGIASSNGFFFGRPPMSIPYRKERIALFDTDADLKAEGMFGQKGNFDEKK